MFTKLLEEGFDVNPPRTKNPGRGSVKVELSAKGAAHSTAERARPAAAPAENPKLAALKRAYFTKKGRAARIARAQQALIEIDKIGSTFKLDKETVKWLAEDPDLEYL